MEDSTKSIISIIFLFIVVIIVYQFGGKKPTTYFLTLVLMSMLAVNATKIKELGVTISNELR